MEKRRNPEQPPASSTSIDGSGPANFREVKAGSIAPGILYRSGHPLRDDVINSASCKPVQAAGIRCVLNLVDKDVDPEEIPEAASWYGALYKEGKIICLNMDMNFPGRDFNRKLRRGLRFMISRDGPCLVHCFAGVDRTGFVAAVLEALMGASMEEIFHDYALSYNDDGTETADVILCFENGDPYINKLIAKNLAAMNRGLPVTDDNVQSAAERYFLEDVGLSADEVSRIAEFLSEGRK